jgi:hypothetical protein
MKRSMTSASARMEQATRGQIGQPAACMIESKSGLRDGVAVQDAGDYGAPADYGLPIAFRFTEVVDNFVQKGTHPPTRANSCDDRSMTNWAAANEFNSLLDRIRVFPAKAHRWTRAGTGTVD